MQTPHLTQRLKHELHKGDVQGSTPAWHTVLDRTFVGPEEVSRPFPMVCALMGLGCSRLTPCQSQGSAACRRRPRAALQLPSLRLCTLRFFFLQAPLDSADCKRSLVSVPLCSLRFALYPGTGNARRARTGSPRQGFVLWLRFPSRSFMKFAALSQGFSARPFPPPCPPCVVPQRPGVQ